MAANDTTTLIEQFEPDLLVSTFFLPFERRSAALAIIGFQAELAHIATQVAEPMVAKIRYAWWREQVDAVFQRRTVYAPAVRAIVPIVEAHSLPRSLFDELVDGHGHDCEAMPFADLQQMEDFAVSTTGSAMKLVARVAGAGAEADPACEYAGAAYGLARQLLDFRHWVTHGRLRLPADLVGPPLPGLAEGGASRFDPVRLDAAFVAVKARIVERLASLNARGVAWRARPAIATAAVARVVGDLRFNAQSGQTVTNWQRLSRIAAANLTGKF